MTASAVGIHEDVHVTGRRILATLVDGLVFGAVGVAMANFFGTIALHDTFGLEVHLGGVAWVVWTGLIALYYILMEGYIGQTLGKMALGIRVVREDNGEVPGLKAATIRTILRIVDGLFSYAVAFVSVVVTEKRQRLGDMAAHTLVVHR
jgi:uncharacterized RDD family membrane protein YckC